MVLQLYSTPRIIRGVQGPNICMSSTSLLGKIKQRFIKISYIDTTSMLVDPLNKVLPVVPFKQHEENMGLISSLDMLN